MILVLLFIIFLCATCVFLMFSKFFKIIKKKNKILFTFNFLFLFSITFFIYIFKSNFWMGSNFFEKIDNNISIIKFNNIKPSDITQAVKAMEEMLLKDPNNIELIKKVAQSKYLLLDFEGALKLFEQGRDISKNDFELLQGEANTRLILEKEKISNKTLFLFKEILYRDPNDLTAIMVIAEQSYKKNNYKEAKIYYEKLLSLIDKNSLEYNEIYKRYNSIEKND